MSTPTLVVMAAGIGNRYGGLKQIEPVGPHGEIIVDYSIYDALKAGFGRVVFVITRDIQEAFRKSVGRNVEKRCETAYVFQALEDLPVGFEIPPGRLKPWGTGHAVLSCRKVVDSPFAVINADDLYGPSSYQTLCDFLKSAQDRDDVQTYFMIGYVLRNTLTEHGHVARGVCLVDDAGFLLGIRERTHIEKFGEIIRYTEDGETWVELPGETVVSMNFWGFTPSLFPELEVRFSHFLHRNRDKLQEAEYFLPDVIGDLIQEKKARVKVLPTNERWFGVTYKQDILGVRQAIRDLIHRGIYPENLWGEAT